MPWIDSTCKSTKIMIESRFSERKHEAVKHLPGEGKQKPETEQDESGQAVTAPALCSVLHGQCHIVTALVRA